MPDTLSTFTEAMALVPDNTSRLVSPDDIRSVSLSLVSDRGGAFGDPAAGPWVIPIAAADTWTDIPLAIAADMVQSPASLFWRMDANGHLFYDYLADWPTTVVPPGYLRSVRMTGLVGIDPDANTWQFAFAVGGVPQLPFFTFDNAGQTNAVVATIISGQGIDVSAAPPVSLQVQNLTNADDLSMNLFSMSLQGGALA